jgi:branched-chain amino acid transport system ATP-binding protein
MTVRAAIRRVADVPADDGGHVLQTRGLDAGYGDVAMVHGLDLHVDRHEVVALLGPNGAGKTTALLTIAGALTPLAGDVVMAGKVVTDALFRRAQRGMSLVSDDRVIFRDLTTAENLRLSDHDPSEAITIFPELEPLLDRKAGLLSGGEQQMLSLGRALARRPALLLADELTLGLAPVVVRKLLAAIRRVADAGTAVLLVEQQARRVLPICDRGYVLSRGCVLLSGTAEELRCNISEIERRYLALDASPASPGSPSATR